jgi:transcriptional regulator with XRE-family HTH domain
MEITERLAKNLKAGRAAKGWSQEALAFEAGLHRTYVSQIERRQKNCTILQLAKLADAFGVEPGRLLDDPSSGPFAGQVREGA